MLTTVRPIQFNGRLCGGRTRPCMLTAERPDGSKVELVGKFSEGCGEFGLAMEVIAARLASDLQLPVPVPYLIDVDPGWVASVSDAEHRELIARSSSVAFGSTLVTGGFSAWSRGNKITKAMAPKALAIFVFDLVTNNTDRRDEKPNCLVRGDEIVIIDHELAFLTEGILGWQPPWMKGSLQSFATPGAHIFWAGLRGKSHSYGEIGRAWQGLSGGRVRGYESLIPPAWASAQTAVDRALNLVLGVCEHITDCLKEVDRVLK